MAGNEDRINEVMSVKTLGKGKELIGWKNTGERKGLVEDMQRRCGGKIRLVKSTSRRKQNTRHHKNPENTQNADTMILKWQGYDTL